MQSTPLPMLLTMLLPMLPYLLVLLIGLVLALNHARRSPADPRPAVFMAIGAALLLFNSTVVMAAQGWWISSLSMRNADSVSFVVTAVRTFQGFISATGVGLLFAGCLIGRRAGQSVG